MVDITEVLRGRTIPALTAGSAAPRTLADLRPGQSAEIVALDPAMAATATGRRLCDLGFGPGSTVDVLRRAPLGDPTLYRVRHYEIALGAPRRSASWSKSTADGRPRALRRRAPRRRTARRGGDRGGGGAAAGPYR